MILNAASGSETDTYKMNWWVSDCSDEILYGIARYIKCKRNADYMKGKGRQKMSRNIIKRRRDLRNKEKVSFVELSSLSVKWFRQMLTQNYSSNFQEL